MRISTLAVLLATALLGCPSSAPPKSRPLAEEPFTLSPKAPAPDPSAEIAADTTNDAPQPTGDTTEVPDPTPPAVFDAGPGRDCPRGKSVPVDFDVAPAAFAGSDAGAAPKEVRLTATNRSAVPRAIQVTEIDLLASSGNARGWQRSTTTPIRRVSLEEGGGGLADNKVNVFPKATVHIVVEFDADTAAAGRRGARVHFTVDEKHACVEASTGRR